MGRPKLSDAEKAARAAARAPAIERINDSAMQNAGSGPSAAGKVFRPSSAGAKVTVACKLGIAYFDLRLFKPNEVWENTQTGPRKIIEHRQYGTIVRLRGTSYPRGTPPEGFPDRPEIIGNAALNPGVDKEFFDAWLEQNKLNPLVVNRMIFAQEDRADVVAQAKEFGAEVSGLEPINPKKDSRMPKPTHSALSEIEKRTD